MKKLSLFICLLLSFTVFAQVEKYIPEPPSPPRLVNDYAHLLTPEQASYLENKLVKYNDSTSTQIAIVTVEDLHDYSAVEYATALGRKWGVGSKKNNGIVILVSTGGGTGNRDAFIATGYGMEGSIPDITANTILQTELIPNLKAGNYYTAFDRASDALIKAAAGEYKAPEGRQGRGSKGVGVGKIILIIIVIIIIMAASGRGGGGGGYVSRRGYGGLLGPMIFGSAGGFRGGGGGWSGGGGGGGGFGGFGGGGFGGGGAGGNW